jgi:tRNA (cytidine/uridine-2'-O-)-methyltransferase
MGISLILKDIYIDKRRGSILHVVLYQPEIPQNTGNIARTCAATSTSLHLIKPLGFTISDKYLKRAGLDYWDEVDIYYYNSYDDFKKKNSDADVYYITTKGKKIYCEITYPNDSFLMFGPETRGLPMDIINNNIDKCLRIPMKDSIRSLNLANSAAIVLFESLRQNNFMNFKKT